MFLSLLRLAVVLAVLVAGRKALQRWIDGPDPTPLPQRPRDGRGAQPAPEPERGTATTAGWVAPDGSGKPPAGYPVKAKVGSKVYRTPGSPGYDRSRPDRCYPSAEAAEADGFTLAKR